jgi:predicted GNAT superfamily acetyltransferase
MAAVGSGNVKVAGRPLPPVSIRRLEGAEFCACEELEREVFEFTDRDLIPAWEMYTVNLHGGITLGAHLDDELIGYSHAFPGWDDGSPFLFSFGLAVKPAFRSRGVGRALKIAQRWHAREAGYELIKWNVDVLATGPLFLYLSRLGASLTGYQPGLYGQFRSVAVDEVVVDWVLDQDLHEESHTERNRQHSWRRRRLERRVEVPWDHESLTATERQRWQAIVRSSIQKLLNEGFVGVAVDRDQTAGRAFLRFELTR